jgi:hypothetical protein
VMELSETDVVADVEKDLPDEAKEDGIQLIQRGALECFRMERMLVTSFTARQNHDLQFTCLARAMSTWGCH